MLVSKVMESKHLFNSLLKYVARGIDSSSEPSRRSLGLIKSGPLALDGLTKAIASVTSLGNMQMFDRGGF